MLPPRLQRLQHFSCPSGTVEQGKGIMNGSFQAIGLVVQVRPGHRLSSLHFGCGWSGLSLVTILVLRLAIQSHGAEPLAACTINQCPAISAFSSVGASLSLSLQWLSVCCRSQHTGEQTVLTAHYTNWLKVSSPKGRDVLCRIQQEFGRTESLLSAETPSNQPPVAVEGRN